MTSPSAACITALESVALPLLVALAGTAGMLAICSVPALTVVEPAKVSVAAR